jgi:hypothetical protein
MVDRAEFFRVADEIRAEGREPSQRLIRERLAKGGSFTDLGRLYVEWAMARDFHPRPTREDLPEHLRARLGALAADIWRDGRDVGAVAARNERDALVMERDKLRLALAETSARVGALEELMAVRPPNVGGARDEPIQAPAPADGDDARAFWNRVMQEIFEWLGDRTLGVDAIFAALRPEVAAEASRRDPAWKPSRLAQKMKERVKRRRFFLEPEEGAFCRRAEAA